MNQTLYINGKIYLEKGRFAQAVLVEDDRIKAVGDTDALRAQAPNAAIYDCGGRTVIPGLNDSHCHMLMVAQNSSYVPIMGSTSIDEVVARAQKFLTAHPQAKGLRGMGWNVVDFVEGEKRDLVRQDLDRISTEIPVFFNRACGHMAVCNTKALELAGVTKDTPQVAGGVIGHEPDGTPNGQFTDNAKTLIAPVVPEPSFDEIEKNFRGVLDYAASCGLTSFQSNDVGTALPPDVTYAILHRYHDAGALTVRYHTQNTYASVEEMERYVTTERGDPRYDDVLSFGPLKLFKDGSIGGRSALLRADYCDDPGNRGVSVWSDEQLDAYCAAADRHDLQIVCHCIGDGAVQSLIERYEKVFRDGKNPLRHGIIHCQIMDLPMIERIVRDGILPMEQPIFLDSDMHALETRIPAELARTSNCYATFLRLGAHQAFGTDSPVEDCNPFPNIYSAVTRKDKHGCPAGGYFPEECISVADAVDAYTIGSAYAQFMEDRKGRIKEGYYADLTVLDRDIFTCDPMDIRGTKPVLTVMGGNVTYKA